METRNETASRVLSSPEFLEYIDCKKKVEGNVSLYSMIGEYESAAAALVKLMENSDYDAAEAIRLTNDVEFLSGQIEKHPDYIALVAANDRLQLFMSTLPVTCSGSCDGCSQNCHKE